MTDRAVPRQNVRGPIHTSSPVEILRLLRRNQLRRQIQPAAQCSLYLCRCLSLFLQIPGRLSSRLVSPAPDKTTSKTQIRSLANSAASRALGQQSAWSSASPSVSHMSSFSDSILRMAPPPPSRKKTLFQCLYAAWHLDETWGPRSRPPGPDPGLMANGNPPERDKKLKTQRYRSGCDMATKDQ